MDDDKKKKKKNKKKNKNKQVDATDNVPLAGNGQLSQDDAAAADSGRSDDVQVFGNGKVSEVVADDRSHDVQDGDVNRNGHEANGAQCGTVDETIKQLQKEIEDAIERLQNENNSHRQKEATLEDTIKRLQNENDSHWQKEATLENTVKRLQNENDSHRQKEATLEDTIKQLQNENDSHRQKEPTLEDNVKRIQKENDSHRQREATLEDTVQRLENENDSRRQKEATLEDSLQQLQHEIDSHMEKEVGLQMEIVQLLSEKDSWLEKEAGLEEKISRLVDEKGTLDSKEASLQEKIECLERDRDAWILKEDSFKEMIATLNNDIARIRAQVLELEQSRNNLVQENQRLMENSSSYQLQIKNLESVSSTPSSDERAKHASGHDDLNSQVEEAHALVEKLMAENAELVEKVNELYVELDRRSATVELTKTKASNTTVVPLETASVIDFMSTSDLNPEGVPVKQEMHSNGNVDMSASDQNLYSREVVPIKQEMHSNGDVESQHAALVPELPVSTDEMSEIVQIPLDENEVGNEELSVENDKNAAVVAVPLIDAPLIGAPFRLVSFVARYVSGADLVNKVPTNS